MMDVRAAVTIAIIEDDFSVRDSMKALLEVNGYIVLSFESGVDFFKRELPKDCACIVLDVDLPRESGFEIVSRLRRQGNMTPVIFISGRATAAMRGRARAARAPLLEKPTPARALLAQLNVLLRRG
ncbi:MAG: response regulator [Alphaproteobacteria bacterium]|mgnify:CR=1 FL=1|jgi:FixJ family two-component response regulator|nr:response regulator [Alphaproteobacteria bacterium]